MSANSASNLKSRLRVVPIDVWSTREKLCLASSVSKSGDQNWSSVSRPLRAFAEPNRPNDWFHQKYCAIQYQELLEKIETETPKRKRSERGEETTQTIIVRNLTKQRIEELREITKLERDLILKMKRDLETIKGKQMNEKRFQEICNEIKEKETKEKEREVEHKKWLEEREVKIALMSRKGTLHVRQKTTTPSTPPTPVTQPTTPVAPVVESAAKSPLNEPLKVEVDSEPNSTPTPTPTVSTTDNKLTLALISPSTSPLLTSLLQSPTPSTPTLLSPNKSGLSANTFNRQKPPLSQVSTPITPVTRRPSIHSLTEKVTEVVAKSEPNVSITTTPSPVVSPKPSNENEPKISGDSPKLSKLLETTNTTKPKTTTITEVKEKEVMEELAQNRDSEQISETSEQTDTSVTTPEESEEIDLKIEVIESEKEVEKLKELVKSEEPEERLSRKTDKSNEPKVDKEVKERKDEKRETETENAIEKRVEESVEKIAIKQEMEEMVVEEDSQPKETEKVSIKEEPMESTSNLTTADDSNPRTPSTRANKRIRKTPNPIAITPTVSTRRSQRVAQKDTKTTNDDSTEVSDQSAANTPQMVKKGGSVDDTTETSMSEESMDAKIAAPVSGSSERVGVNSESERSERSERVVRTEESENGKEYRTWKKAVMVNWRLISAHKNASLFSHPVTEAEAKGYEDIVHQPMDLNSIKKRVETGVIRTTPEYMRDIMLMFQNAIMFNNAEHDVHKMAVDMQKDTIATIEDFIETRKHDNPNNESKLRARERRTNVSTVSPIAVETEISGRRKSRGASTDTDSNSGLTKSISKKKKT